MTKNNMTNDNTIFIYTDGGMATDKDEVKSTGLGLFITHKNRAYRYAKALGSQSVLYSELDAIISAPSTSSFKRPISKH